MTHCVVMEILDLMEQVNRAVKGGEFSAFLGTQILRLITQLKKYGSSMENSHQQELNNVFISLRQACCRDSGQLGTMCRLEIMELIEFRAMGWRPNLAHSRYYMKRSCGSIANQDLNYNENAATNETDHLPTAPESAPPFGTVTINPFAFNFPGGAQIASTADLSSLQPVGLVSATPAMAGATPYFLIPASPLSHPQTGIAFISPTANVIAPAIATKPLASGLSHPNIYQKGTPINNPSPPLTSNKMVSKTTSKPNRPLKSSGKNLCRSDIVIRNADSGKVMGVKGRRVAVIEEMSNTIVSFQKGKKTFYIVRLYSIIRKGCTSCIGFSVTPNSKDRTITINGPNEEAIELATSLIEETIRRNVSPDRAKSSETGSVDNRQNLSPGKVVHRGGTCSGIIRSGSEEHVGNVKLRNSKRESEMEIMTGDNGEMLKLISANPKLLQTARKALDGNHEQNSSRNLERHNNSSWSFNRRKSLSSLNENLKNLIMETVPELEKDLIQENIT
ncbi:putative KH domain protein [Trichinella spiralis]|uniref:putative KH domain protein n=1 Tax=Trichinella spiralis TaxID=6334 RepID=UPI0001EFD341|nr:putative KH domain protein [Trichinella spiralis]